MTAKIIIAGGREFKDYPYLVGVMNRLTQNLTDIEVVCGGARGADTLGEDWAKEYGHSIKYFYPDWEGNGRAAGPIRNRAMAEYGTHLVAFDTGGRGTANMIEEATKKGLNVRVIRYE